MTAAKPLKVYIMAGPFNVEGLCDVGTLGYIGDDPATAPMLREMLGPDGKPVACEKAHFIRDVRCVGICRLRGGTM